MTSGGLDWRPVQTCSLEDPPLPHPLPLPPARAGKRPVRILLEWFRKQRANGKWVRNPIPYQDQEQSNIHCSLLGVVLGPWMNGPYSLQISFWKGSLYPIVSKPFRFDVCCKPYFKRRYFLGLTLGISTSLSITKHHTSRCRILVLMTEIWIL